MRSDELNTDTQPESSGGESSEEWKERLLTEALAYEEQGLTKEAVKIYKQILSGGSSLTHEKRTHFRSKIESLNLILADPLSGISRPEKVNEVVYLDDDGAIYSEEGEEKKNDLVKKFTVYTLKQKVFINILFVLLTLFGLFSLFSSPVENMPAVDIGEVYITTYFYGASADEVENLVTIPIEKAIDGLENVASVTSKTFRNVSSVGVKFTDDSDYRELFSRLRIRVLNMKNKLPEACDDPRFLFVDTHWWISVIRVNIFGDIPKESQRQLAEKLKVELNPVSGIRDIEISGKYINEFHVSLDPQKLRKFGVTFSEVAEAVRSAGTRIPTGHFRTEASEFILDAGNTFSRQEEVLHVIVRKDGSGNFIRVSDLVTNARLSHKSPVNIVSINGEDTISLVVRKEDAGNAISIARDVKKIAERFAEEHKKDGIKIAFTNDSTVEIDNATSTLSGNMILGIILVTLILWMTLGFRNAMLAAVGIPFSFLCAVIIMKATGLSINSLDLFAFILVSGIIVDDAVIIIENVFRHQQLGKGLRQAVIDGVAEVFFPVISSALTTIMAFIPMLLMSGAVGDFFAVIPKTVTYALLASVIEALLFLPLHIYDWGGSKQHEKEIIDTSDNLENAHVRSGIFATFWWVYNGTLDRVFKHQLKTMVVVSGLFILSSVILWLSITGIVPLIKIKFFPGNYIRYHIAVAMPPGTPIEKTDGVVRGLSNMIMALGEGQAESASGAAGYYEDEDYRWLSGSQYGQVIVTLPTRENADYPENPGNDPMIHLNYVRDKVTDYLDKTFINDPARPLEKVFPENTGPPAGKPVSIRISGDTLHRNVTVSDLILGYLKTEADTGDLTELRDDRANLQTVIKFIPKQDKVFEHGLSPGDVTVVAAGTLNGIKVGKFRALSEEVDLVVRLARVTDKGNTRKAGLADPIDIMGLPVVEHSSAPLFLRDLLTVRYVKEPDSRGRYNGKATVTITAGIKAGSDISSKRVEYLVKQFFTSIADDYPDVIISFGGESQSTKDSYSSLVFGFLIAILIIYLILAAQFGDYFQPLIILSAVVFAIIGVVIGMFLTGSIFTLGSFLAIIGLAGVAVNDSLILVDFMNQGVDDGKSLRQAIVDACSTRMRPVLLTTITTILGLLPMALGIPYKSLEWAPMATAFVTGLGFSTVLTLLVVPVEYELIVKFRFWLKKVRM